MDKKIFGFALVMVLLSLGFMMFGCKNEQIKFNRDSEVTNFLDSISKPNQKDETKKSGSMIIIKEKSKNSAPSFNFGPRVINFDMPDAIK